MASCRVMASTPTLAGAMRQRRRSGQSHMRIGGGEIQDGSTASFDEMRPHRLACNEYHIQFAHQGLLPVLLVVHLLNPRKGTEGRGVHQNVDTAEALHRRAHQALRIRGHAQIDGVDAFNGYAQFPCPRHPLLGRLGIDIAAHDIRAHAAQTSGRSPWPMPLPIPVTMATFPAKRFDSMCTPTKGHDCTPMEGMHQLDSA